MLHRAEDGHHSTVQLKKDDEPAGFNKKGQHFSTQ